MREAAQNEETLMTKRISCLILALLTVLSFAAVAAADGAPAELAVSARTGKLPAPALGAVSCTAQGAKIAWSAVPGAARYRVYYKTASGWQRIAETTANTLIWVGAKSGTSYTFTVRAFDGAGQGGYYDTAGKSLSYVAAPQISQAACAAGGVKLQWNAVAGAAGGYRVYRKTAGGWQRIGDTTGTSFTWTGAKSGESYTFTVRCLAADKKSFLSAYDTVGRTVTYLAPPVVRQVSCADGGVQVQWDAVPGAAQYRVFYKTTGGWQRAGTATGTGFLWAGAQSGTAYAFTVRCLSADGKSYTSAYDTKGKSLTYIAAPAIKNAVSTAGGMELSWDAVPGAALYRVYLRAPDGWNKLGDTTGTSFTWPDARDQVGYVFTVRCLSADGKRFTSAYDTAGYPALYEFKATRPLENLGKVSGLCQGNRGCCLATSFSMAANIILGWDKYGPYDWTAPGSDAANVGPNTTLTGSDGYTYKVHISAAASVDDLRTIIDRSLADGCPIIIPVHNLSTANTHYVVAVGYDETLGEYLIADPAVAGGPMTSAAVPIKSNRNMSLGNKDGTLTYIGFTRSQA